MSEQAAKEQYEVERRVMRGMDNFTDLSLLPEDYFRETKNLTVNGGIHETRPGSTRYGMASFSGLVGEQHGMTFITTLQGEWCLAHIGNALYAAIADSGAAPTRILDLAGANLVVPDSNHPSRQPFVQIQLEFDTGGFRIYKILFRSKGGCKVLEYKEADGTWVGRAPAILADSLTRIFALVATAITGQILGTYRIRVSPARIVNGVRVSEGPNFVRNFTYDDLEYMQIDLTVAGQNVGVNIYGVQPVGMTHWIVETTRVLSLVGASSFSNNGNDPTLYYEAAIIPRDNVAPGSAYLDLDLRNLTTPKPDTRNFQALPAHDISVFSGGVLFVGGVGQSQSRIFAAGADGLSTHSEMYNPGQFITADEADGKVMTAMELVGPHLGVWKENKTGVVLNADPLGSVTWRDRKIGAPAQGCVSMLTEDQAIVLCHDGAVRLFDGSTYDHSLALGDSGVEISNPVRNFTERIFPATASFIWHREKLHLLYDVIGIRRALVLHAREGYEWTPWDGLTHFVNALAENELKWIFMDQDSGLLYEQSPLDPVYLDRDQDVIQWSRHDGALWPKNRRSSIVVEDCFLEGIFGMLTEAHFELDEQRVVSAAVGISPLPGLKASVNQRWFKCWAEEDAELRCHSLELYLEGIGYSLHRATQYRVIEEASFGVPGVPVASGDIFAFLPSWGAPVIFYARFEQDAELQYDVSGHRRNLAWYPGDGGAALRSHIAGMPPYGGEVVAVNGEGQAGWRSNAWDGMDYLGDEDGACSQPQVFEAVLARVDADNAYLEDAAGPNGTWRIRTNEDGSVQFQLFTNGGTTKRWQWSTAAGVMAVTAPGAPYTLQAVLYNGGDNLKAWIASSSAVMAEVAVTRTALAVESGYLGDHYVVRGGNLYVSHFRRMARIRTENEARIFHNLIKGLL